VTSKSLDWNWDRSVYVTGEISDESVAALLPQILKLKQQSADPITVGIDSVGGSIHATNQLLKILRSPDQQGRRCRVVTVAINKAFSAAATLLALGDYAVAMPSAQVLYHDLRYGEVFDVTSTKAAKAAADLSRENDELALRLAKLVVERVTWNMIDLAEDFESVTNRYPKVASEVEKIAVDMNLQQTTPRLRLAGLICSLFAQTSPVGDLLLGKTIKRLQTWRKLEVAYNAFGDQNKPELESRALFRNDNPLTSIISQTFPDRPAFMWETRGGLKDDLSLFLLLALTHAIEDDHFRVTDESVAELMREYQFFRELRQPEHVELVMDILIQNDIPLFGVVLTGKDKDVKDEEHKNLVLELFPQAQIFWAFVLVLCRNLLNGEHLLSLSDVLYLGLVDEVVGRKKPEPRRLYRHRMDAERLAAAQQAGIKNAPAAGPSTPQE
jgi:ATP-dependent protease ClpP protease subunit